MSTSTYEETGNVHLDMNLEAILPYHEVIGSLVLKYANKDKKILDIGCGLGHIEKVIADANSDLKVDIADAYDMCLKTTASRGNVGTQYTIDELTFNVANVVDQKYDVIVMSHVLEHLIFPAKALDDVLGLLKEEGVLIVAVPNPVRPSVFITNLFKSHYVNRGHVHSWDPSHWKNFLENIMGLEVLEYVTDYIQLPKATKINAMRKIGKFLVKAAPWWGFSNIAVIKKTDARSSLYSSWKNLA